MFEVLGSLMQDAAILVDRNRIFPMMQEAAAFCNVMRIHSSPPLSFGLEFQ